VTPGHARASLHNPPERLLPQIAVLTVKFASSHVQVAIKTHYHAALEPEEDNQAVFRSARPDSATDVIQHR